MADDAGDSEGATIAEAARELLPNAAIATTVMLTEEDAHWYSHYQKCRLPLLR